MPIVGVPSITNHTIICPQSITISKIEQKIVRAKVLWIILGCVIGVGIVATAIVTGLVWTRRQTILSPIITTMTTPTAISHSSLSTVLTSNYSSALTADDNTFMRTNDSTLYYYEAIQVTVDSSGNYSFADMSFIDSYGYLYMNSFNPFNPCINLLTQNDDANDETIQFQIEYALQSGVTYILVFTTYAPGVTAEFLIIASGPAPVKFLHSNDIALTLAPSSLISTNEIVNGVYNTRMGGDSIESTSGIGPGYYPSAESPDKACDANYNTKYLSFGSCGQQDSNGLCGLNTGFYLTLQRGSSLVTGLQTCTGNNAPERDPLTITLEGSNQTGTDLNVGVSWSVIYSGLSGLSIDPGRLTCGVTQFICNSVQYMSYRFLVTSKRNNGNSVQYSEVQLFGY